MEWNRSLIPQIYRLNKLFVWSNQQLVFILHSGDEISAEDAAAFLETDPEAEDEEEEEPLFFPASVTLLQAFYLTPGRFVVSMGDYDAGYLYECTFSDAGLNNAEVEAEEAARAVAVEGNIMFLSTKKKVSDSFYLLTRFYDAIWK